MKKSWIKPELIVLVRNIMDENVLTKCKNSTQIISYLSTVKSSSNPNSSKSSCMLRLFGHGRHKVCVTCVTPNDS